MALIIHVDALWITNVFLSGQYTFGSIAASTTIGLMGKADRQILMCSEDANGVEETIISHNKILFRRQKAVECLVCYSDANLAETGDENQESGFDLVTSL